MHALLNLAGTRKRDEMKATAVAVRMAFGADVEGFKKYLKDEDK